MHSSDQYAKRIAIIYPADYLESVPVVRNTIIMLAKNGYFVEVFIYKSDGQHPSVQFRERNIIIHTLQKSTTGIKKIVPNIIMFTKWASQICHKNKYLCFFGIDPAGLCVVGLLGLLYRVPWVYFSLELIISSDPIRQYPYYKTPEKWFSRRCSLVITQDEKRAQLMAEDNNIPLSRFVLIPNSPLGAARYRKTDFFQKAFALKAVDKILLSAGSLADFTLTRELMSAAQRFPKNWKLVLHGRSNLDDLPSYIKNNNNILISKEAVAYDKLKEIIDSADIGLAFYDLAKSPNLIFAGKSSGKISQYLQCGLPVIIGKMPGWEEAIDQYHSGISVSSPKEIISAANTIFDNYEWFSQGALEHFEKELRFEPPFFSLLERLKNLSPGNIN